MFFKKFELIHYSNYLINIFPIFGLRINIINNNIFFCLPKNKIKLILNLFKNHTLFNFKCLMDIFGNDLVSSSQRFNVVYCLLNCFLNYRFFIKISCNKFEKIDSSMLIFNAANWLEREVWDMFGIFFNNHSDLRKILTDYGFKGFPLRKDFPLVGYKQLRFDEISQTLIYEPVVLAQKYRFFNLSSPWNKPLKPIIYNII